MRGSHMKQGGAMDAETLDTCLRNLVIYALSASEKVTTDSPLEEIDAIKYEIERRLQDAKTRILNAIKERR
jgi:hypothetical protein